MRAGHGSAPPSSSELAAIRRTRRRPGWLGYDDEKIVTLVHEALAAGFTHVKMKVGTDLDSDARRAALDP